jgi:hypothetical protein
MTTHDYRNLLVGCGHARDKRLEPAHWQPGVDPQKRIAPRVWRGRLETLDYESPCEPDIVWDLNVTPWRRSGGDILAADTYDEIHAYEVLEHLGAQGDYRGFFDTFSEVWRLLKPGGFLCATCPSRRSHWLWGDPGHRRVVLPVSLLFLQQPEYERQKGLTNMSDYRTVYRADFEVVHTHDNNQTHSFILQAVKPSRCPL